MIALGVIAGLAVVSLLLAWGLTYGAARLMRLADAGWKRAALVVLAIGLLQWTALAGFEFLPRSVRENLPFAFAYALLAFLSPFVVYRIAYRATGRQLLVFLG